MKLIFINRFFHPDHSATSQMLSGIAFGLAQRGLSVAVITSRLRYDRPQDALPASETVNGVEILRVASTRQGRGSLLGRTSDYATFYASALRMLSKIARQGDVIIAKTDPPLLSIGAASIARLRKAVLVNWLQDIFPETAERLGVGDRGIGRLAVKTLTRMRDTSLRAADANVVLGERMLAFVAARGLPQDQARIIPNWADGRQIKPIAANANRLREAWGLRDAFVVGYSGNLGRAHDVETMLQAIQQTEAASAAKMPPGHHVGSRPVRWLIVGSGSQNEILRREVERRRLGSVLFQPYQPTEQLAESLSAADVHIVTLKPSLEGLIVPSKFYGIAAAGRPVLFIGDPNGEIGSIVERFAIGHTVLQGDATALADVVLGLAADPDRATAEGMQARALFEREYDLSIALDRWEALISAVTRSRATESAGHDA